MIPDSRQTALVRPGLRALVVAFDFLSLLIIALLLSLGFAQPAYAYVDPSVMTYTIQALAGVAVAIGAVAGVAFRRTRNALMRALHIDADAKKVKEPLVHKIEAMDDEGRMQADRRAKEVFEAGKAAARGPRHARDELTKRERLCFAFAACGFLAFTLMIMAPAELVQGGGEDLVFSLGQIILALIACALVFTACAGALVSAARGRAFDCMLAIIFALALCCYLQPLFFNTGLGVADGSLVDWESKTPTMIANLIIWIVILGAVLAFSIWKPRIARFGMLGLSIALIVVQSVGVASLMIEAMEQPKLYGTYGGFFDVSSKRNSIMFVLDTLDSDIVFELERKNPDLFAEVTSELDDFTFFPNTTGAMIPTGYAIPYLLTGQTPESNMSWDDYREHIYERSTYLNGISQAGFSIGVYTDSLCPDQWASSFFPEHSISHNSHHAGVRHIPLSAMLLQCALYRDAPWVLKPFFWFTTDQVNVTAMHSVYDVGFENATYVMDDASVYSYLQTKRLSVQSEDARYEGAFRFIHLLGSHPPYIMDESGKAGASDELMQTAGSLRIVNEYIRQLKELGTYDASTIVITADHGYWYATDGVLEAPTCPAIFVKLSDDLRDELEADDPDSIAFLPSPSDQGFAVSYAPITHGDALATLAQSARFDGSAFGANAFSIDPNAERTRVFFNSMNDGEGNYAVQKYLIEGDALDIANWHPTDEVWKIRERAAKPDTFSAWRSVKPEKASAPQPN